MGLALFRTASEAVVAMTAADQACRASLHSAASEAARTGNRALASEARTQAARWRPGDVGRRGRHWIVSRSGGWYLHTNGRYTRTAG